jgi:myosin heavy subunit
MEIYTYVGPILLVLNPFKGIPGLNDDENRLRYVEIVNHPQPLTLKKELPPHSFALTALAYQSLKKDKQRQGIVISGESGAGKTESAKVCMEFLTKLVSSDEESKEDDIGTKILACNPILEGFGNAKTVRNDNSSRFGKYVLMFFATGSSQDKVYGASIKNYLLEKSRVVMVEENERGYHIFYFLLGGASNDTLRECNLLNASGQPMKWSDFNYFKKSGIRVEDVEQEFREVEETMKKMDLTDDEIMSIWKCVAAVMLLGQLEFDKTKFSEEGTHVGEIKNKDLALKIGAMLGF